jgi:membrane protein YqaA with SNARE-associated domain
LDSKRQKAKGKKQKSNLKSAQTINHQEVAISSISAEPTSRKLIEDRQEFSAATGRPQGPDSAIRPPAFAFCLLPFAFLLGVGQKLADLGSTLLAYGALGLFAITLLDSAFIPIPGGPDAAMIILSATNPSRMIVYALVATIGSTIGCTILYLIARRAGVAALSRVNSERRERIENLLGRYDMLAVMLPAVLPPPFPFKPFVLSAGVFKLKLPRFVAAIFIGRAVRFLIEGWLAIRFGTEALPLIKQHGLKVLMVVGLLLLMFFIASYFRRKRQPPALAVDESRSPN